MNTNLFFRILLVCVLLIPAADSGARPLPAGLRTDRDTPWERTGGLLVMTAPGDSTGRWLTHRAALEEPILEGDFTIEAEAGFSPEAYPMSSDTTLSWKIYYRAMAFGLMQDSANALLGTFARTNGALNGIVRLVDGREVWLCRPYSGQGHGLEVHDPRKLSMTRNGCTVTVRADGRIVCRAVDTTGVKIFGRAVVCGPGPVGLAVAGISARRGAPGPQRWNGTQQAARFLFRLDEPSGHIIRSEDSLVWGTVEVGSAPGGPGKKFGRRMEGGTYEASGGQLTVQGYAMGPRATLETWFKLIEVPEGGVPILQLLFDGTPQDSSWTGRERGGPMAFRYRDGSVGLHFHEFGDVMADLPGVFRTGEWTHLAWVRDGVHHTIYVNSREALSFDMNRYGARTLREIQVNMAQNADHDWITRAGRPVMLIDNLRATARALGPGGFLERDILTGKSTGRSN